MSLVRLNTKPSPRDLRVFSALWLVFFAIGGAIAGRSGSATVAHGLWAVGGTGGVAGLLYPPAMRYVYLGAIYVAFPIGFVSSYLILSAVYYLVLTPIGLIMRLVGHDPLQRRFDAAQRSYWRPRAEKRSATSYFRQH